MKFEVKTSVSPTQGYVYSYLVPESGKNCPLYTAVYSDVANATRHLASEQAIKEVSEYLLSH